MFLTLAHRSSGPLTVWLGFRLAFASAVQLNHMHNTDSHRAGAAGKLQRRPRSLLCQPERPFLTMPGQEQTHKHTHALTSCTVHVGFRTSMEYVTSSPRVRMKLLANASIFTTSTCVTGKSIVGDCRLIRWSVPALGKALPCLKQAYLAPKEQNLHALCSLVFVISEEAWPPRHYM